MRKLLGILGLALVACGPHSTTTGSGGGGNLALVTVNGKQKLYLPLTDNMTANATIAVVNVALEGGGTQGAPGQLTAIDLGTSDYATTTAGDSTLIVAASTDFPDIWLIDPTTDLVTKSFQLDSTFGTSGFVQAGGYVTGIAMDSANHRAILAVWNGFAILDTVSQSITSTIFAAPSENFGFDPSAQRIIAPFYACASAMSSGAPPATCGNYKASDGTVITDGLNVIDLKDGTVYTYENPTAADPHKPVGTEPSSAAVDPTSGVAVVPSEADTFQNVIDVAHASFNKASGTFTAPDHVYPMQSLSGVGIDSVNHLAFFEQELVPDVGLVDLVAANAGTATFVHDQMPSAPGTTTEWSSDADQVAVAVVGGTPSGFVIDGTRTWVGRVDLTKMSSGPIASAVTFLNARVKP